MKMDSVFRKYWAPEKGDGGTGGGENPDNESAGGEKEASYKTFDEVLSTMEEPVRALYDEHVAGLKSALEKEREARSNLNKTLKEIQPKAEKGSELEAKLSETLGKLEEAEKQYQETQRRATFAEEATKPEVGCVNPRVAYALAVSEDMFDKEGRPDWVALKKSAPELFQLNANTNAGNRRKGAGDSINDHIRQVVGL